MKSKRRILIGDCSELYRKKGQTTTNVNIEVPYETRDQIIRALRNMSFGVDRAVGRDQEITGSSWYMDGGRVAPNETRITQTGPPDEYESIRDAVDQNRVRLPSHNHDIRVIDSQEWPASPPRHASARHTIPLETDEELQAGDVVFFDQNGKITKHHNTAPGEEIRPAGIAMSPTEIAFHSGTTYQGRQIGGTLHRIIRTNPNNQVDPRPVRYVIHEGPISSTQDGDVHYLNYIQIMDLYGVDRSHCRLASAHDYGVGVGLWSDEYRIVHLYPQANGDYSLPERDRRT